MTLPPSLERYADKLADLGQKKKPQREYSETKLHIAVVDYLRGEVRQGKNVIKVQRPFDCIWLHPVNEFKDEKEAYWGTRKGILPGAADLLFWWKPYIEINAGAIELKDRASLTPNQQKFKDDFMSMGGKWALCRTVAQVRDTLIQWGLPCKHMHCIEPALSIREKQQMSTLWQAPR